MQRNASVRTRIATLAVAAVGGTVFIVGTAPVEAVTVHASALMATSTTRLVRVQGLAASVTKPDQAYRVHGTWDPLSVATGYKVSLLDSAGNVLASAKVTQPAWTAKTTLPVGSAVKLRVVAYNAKRNGQPASVSTRLPDLTAPTGTFSLVQDSTNEAHVSVTQDSLTDDLSAAANITRTIDWGDGSPAETWASGQVTGSHDYQTDMHVYYPTVTLTDEAGNAAVVPLATVVVGDTTAPTGSFTVSPATGWAKYTVVTVTQTALGDNLSTVDKIARTVDWNDGTAPQAWPSGLTLTHVYPAAGTFTPTVSMTDEAKNSATATTSEVVASADTVKPVAKLRRPATRPRHVSSWTTLRGVATDTNGSGVRNVRLQVVEKRGTAWYAYRGTTRTWVKAGTKAAALTKSRLAYTGTTATHRWSYRLPGLRKGLLVVKVSARDNVGNTSAATAYKQLLTRS